jgi:hypothetical protein
MNNAGVAKLIWSGQKWIIGIHILTSLKPETESQVWLQANYKCKQSIHIRCTAIISPMMPLRKLTT